jgi:hypothetical protein
VSQGPWQLALVLIAIYIRILALRAAEAMILTKISSVYEDLREDLSHRQPKSKRTSMSRLASEHVDLLASWIKKPPPAQVEQQIMFSIKSSMNSKQKDLQFLLRRQKELRFLLWTKTRCSHEVPSTASEGAYWTRSEKLEDAMSAQQQNEDTQRA